MKRLVDLSIEDLEADPVWRYEGGSGAEAAAVPVRRDSLSGADDEIFLAATQFELADSSRHTGYCFPVDGDSIDYLQPSIVTRSGHVAFWFEEQPSPDVLQRQWAALGKEPGKIFPVSFHCLVPVDGRSVRGRIDGVEFSNDLLDAPAGDAAAPRRRAIGSGETRAARRRPAEMTVEFHQGDVSGSGVTGDISRRGVFVRSNWIPGTGPVVRLTVNLPGGRKLALSGRVVRSVDPGTPSSQSSPGFGLRLLDDWPGYDDLFGRRGPKR